MVQQAVFGSGVDTLLKDKTQEENIFSNEFVNKLEYAKLPSPSFVGKRARQTQG